MKCIFCFYHSRLWDVFRLSHEVPLKKKEVKLVKQEIRHVDKDVCQVHAVHLEPPDLGRLAHLMRQAHLKVLPVK